MRSMSPHVRCGVAALFLCLATAAQQCVGNARLLKNDVLPASPGGSISTVAIVPGLCEGEAAMSVFDAGGAVSVKSVAVAFVHRLATNGVQAVVDLEIYDGASVGANGKYALGPLLFKLSNASSNLQIQSTGLNSYTLPKPVLVPSGKPVIGFRMIKTLAGGSCQLGYDANFCTDNQWSCAPGRNILDASGHGPVDPCTYTGFGVPLYPIYFRGDWVIRACVEPEVSASWTGNATPGGFVSLQFHAPGQAGDSYLAFVSGGIRTGFPTPWGLLPLDPDPIFVCFLGDCRAALFGGAGTFNAQDKAFGAIAIPNLASLKNSGLTLHAGFVTFQAPSFVPWKSISAPSPPIVIR